MLSALLQVRTHGHNPRLFGGGRAAPHGRSLAIEHGRVNPDVPRYWRLPANAESDEVCLRDTFMARQTESAKRSGKVSSQYGPIVSSWGPLMTLLMSK